MVVEQTIEARLGGDFAPAMRRDFSVDAILKSGSIETGPAAFLIDMIYLAAAVLVASACFAMLAIAAPLALCIGGLACLFLGAPTPTAWRPVRSR